MQIHRIDIEGVLIGRRLRALNEDVVSALAESMKRFGLLNPISVYAPSDAEAWLVTGHHRLEAAKRLGWDFIDGVFVDGDEIDRELREITENLHRAELTALERDEQVARWIELTAARVVSGQDAQKPLRGGRPEGGLSAASRDLGIERTEARRAVKVASLSDEAKRAARATDLDDNRSALLAAAKEATPEKQVAKISEIAASKIVPKPQKPADAPLNDYETTERQVAALMAAWNKAGREAREEFMSRIDHPVMDHGYGAMNERT